MSRAKTASILVGSLVGLALAASAYRGANKRPTGEDRVRHARVAKGAAVKQLVLNVGISYPPRSLYIRAFKRERQMELWASSSTTQPHKLVKTYTIAAVSGDVGPKRREGDYQVPEGFYTIDRFNPLSSYHLSLGLDYPNKSDRILSDKKHPGGDIFIHGNRVSIGCMAMTDDKIEEIYVLASDVRSAGQKKIPVHIFPCRLDNRSFAALKREYPNRWLHAFWEPLQVAYLRFENTGLVPTAKVLGNGRYAVKA
jgi:murein L,D-transpeptidase YafK